MTIEEIQANARWLVAKHGWNNDPDDRFRRLIGEVGELAAELSERQRDEQRIAHEIFDVIWNACDLANKLDIDLTPHFRDKMAANAEREWGK